MAKTNEELVRDLIDSFNNLKSKIEDPSYGQLESIVQRLADAQDEMKRDLHELKEKLLDPDDGAIVKINKNTSFRKDTEEDWERILQEHKELMEWKTRLNKASWIIFSTSVTVLLGILGWFLTNEFSV